MSFVRKFISELDFYLADNVTTIKCSDFANLYFDFIDEISLLGGKTRDLTGMTEFLFGRAFYYLNKEAILTQNLSIRGDVVGTRRQPDIVVYKDSRPKISVEVKSNYNNIDEDYGRHGEVVEVHPDIITCTIAFTVEKKASLKKIENYKKTSDYYQCLILDSSSEKLVNALGSVGLIL